MNEKMKVDSIEKSVISGDPKDYPSNSKSTNEVTVTKKVEKVITGKVIERKKPLSKKVVELFMGEGNDAQSVSEYVIKDILIPSAKGMFLDTVSTLGDMIRVSVEMALFGTASGNSRNRSRNRNGGSSGKTYVSYDNYSSDRSSSRVNDREKSRERRPSADHNRSNHSFDGIVLASRGEADKVITSLIDLTIDYGVASVADLYDLVGITSKFTDNEYGWKELDTNNATFTRTRDGYILNLPKTRPIN
jgi:hypothetical protein